VNQTRCWKVFTDRLWTVDRKTFNLLAKDDKDPRAYNALRRKERTAPTLAPLNPFRIDPRRHIQQSTFVVPLRANRSFWENLVHSLKSHEYFKIRVSLSAQSMQETLIELRLANTTPLTLFPGVEGLARSVWHVALLPELRPKPVPRRLTKKRTPRSDATRRPKNRN
jgi:hypothetical protein